MAEKWPRVGIVNTIKKELGNIDRKELEKELVSEEVEDLLTRISNVNHKLKNVIQDYDSNADNY
ncbi:Imm3 family immunity protein [Bacillus arachidis]|uniref:Imm3 family immunity protein n=1 Tax=Bacillus arachidis TaxID=2819290 RepID=UPI00255CBB2F|nr:Imm3 family immunity protein [Bacillus arachidis]WIY63176.1 Imm3 family immunity protein [Bacillus arachidis]